MKPDDLSPLYNLTGPSNTNLNGLEMAQNCIAPAAWALAILKYKPSMVIEIGTSKGACHLSCPVALLTTEANFTRWTFMAMAITINIHFTEMPRFI